MCRFVAYLGPPLTLEALVLQPPHSLLRQSWAPRHQGRGLLNADGFGVGWYDPRQRPEPARYRTARPLWADRSFASFAGLVSSPAVMAAVRSATPPSPVEESGSPPFTAGPWLFAHNGAVDGFHSGLGPGLRRLVSDARALVIEGASDSEVLFALVLDRLDAGARPAEALVDVVALVLERATARLNLVLTDGQEVAATAVGNSLFLREDPASVVVASEPFDDEPRWAPVPDGSVTEGDVRRGLSVRPLGARPVEGVAG